MLNMVQTDYLIIDSDCPQPEYIKRAAQVIQKGGLVAFPTETVYGLGAKALDPESVQQIFRAKGRPSNKPLIVHIADWESLGQIVSTISETARRLGEKFWPGPLTLVLPRHPNVPMEVTAGSETVAVRWPANIIAEELIRAVGMPLVAPSANRSGKPSPTDAGHVMEDLGGKIELILDGGMTRLGVESTVLDLTKEVPTILRPGGVTREQLEEVLGEVRVQERVIVSEEAELEIEPQAEAETSSESSSEEYIKEKPLILVQAKEEELVQRILEIMDIMRERGMKIGILTSLENYPKYRDVKYPPDYLQVMGSRNDLADVALFLFKTLRESQLADVDTILVESFPEEGLGMAIMDRLRQACRGKVMKV